MQPVQSSCGPALESESVVFLVQPRGRIMELAVILAGDTSDLHTVEQLQGWQGADQDREATSISELAAVAGALNRVSACRSALRRLAVGILVRLGCPDELLGCQGFQTPTHLRARCSLSTAASPLPCRPQAHVREGSSPFAGCLKWSRFLRMAGHPSALTRRRGACRCLLETGSCWRMGTAWCWPTTSCRSCQSMR